MSKVFTFSIMGIDWQVYLQSPSSYKKIHGSDSEAITYPSDREVYFNKDYFSAETIRHEVFHCYVASSPTNSATLNADQKEEQCCELFEKYGPLMMLQVDQILCFFSRKNVLK
jgi:hypothetical protein